MRRTFLAPVMAALAAVPAAAQTGLPWDLDADSRIDREEYDAGYRGSNIYADYDADADGLFDAAELGDVTYAMMDLDNDGVVSVAEWDTWVDTRIGEGAVNLSVAEWDENADDIISRAEFDDETVARDWYGGYDLDRDGYIADNEFGEAAWHMGDFDNDGVLAENEFIFGERFNF